MYNFVHKIFLEESIHAQAQIGCVMCVCVCGSYFSQFNLVKRFCCSCSFFSFNRIRKSETPFWCMCVRRCWCVCCSVWSERGKKNKPNSFHAKNEIQFNYTRSASSTCAPSQCSPPIAVNKLPLYIMWIILSLALVSPHIFLIALSSFLTLFFNCSIAVYCGCLWTNNRFLRSNIRFDWFFN